MKAENRSPEKTTVQGWTFRVSHPKSPSEPTVPLLLLHGHLGNEKVMWTLARPIPNTVLMIAPRAPMKMGVDQYSWHEISQKWPSIEKYQSLVDDLLAGVKALFDKEGLSVSQFDLMGFSQGGVMAYAFAMLHPELIRKVASIASFIPQSWMKQYDQATFDTQEVFIAHGTRDEIVPLSKARQAVDWLRDKNAHVTFCEADTGHKISADCLNGLGEFFTNGR